jgi:hypothetical protein
MCKHSEAVQVGAAALGLLAFTFLFLMLAFCL